MYHVEIIVKATGKPGIDCDFTDIKSALDSIIDNSKDNRYIVRVLNGIYDISDDGNLFLGMKNYVDIVGQSRGGVSIIKKDSCYSDEKAVFDPAFYHEPIEYASLRNMTIISKNLKCPVHIDNELLLGTIELIDCTLINENTPDMGNYQNCLACGLRKQQRVIASGIHANGMLWVHNCIHSYNDEGCRFELYNCISKFITVGDLLTYGKDIVIIEGCKAEFLRYAYFKDPCGEKRLRPYLQSSFIFRLIGNNIDYIEEAVTTDGGYTFNPGAFNELYGGMWSICEPSIHQFCRNTGHNTITKGSPVMLDTAADMNGIQSWSYDNRLYGVALDDIPIHCFGIVQYRGIVRLNCCPGSIMFDDALELDPAGNAVKHTNGRMIGFAREVPDKDSSKIKVMIYK